MSTEGNKEAVLRVTKVRTKLKGDGSWLQRRSEPQAETTEEKPWMAEVRASRQNGAPVGTSPVASPTTPTSPPSKTDTERAPTSGFLIRGIFTKLDKPAAPTNGVSVPTQFNKKPSESYKKIAPYTVRSTPDSPEAQLSKEEHEKRTEAASSVLKKSASRQRSYVLSAAKKYESQEEAPDPFVKSSPSFVAKRVLITDDDDGVPTPAPASPPPPSSVLPVASVTSPPQPRPRKIVDTSVQTAVDVAVNEPVEPKTEEQEEEEEVDAAAAAPESVKGDPPLESVTDPFKDMKPGCTKVATPLPELIIESVQIVPIEPEPEDSVVSSLEDLTPEFLTPTSPTSASPPSASPEPELPALVSLTPEPPAPVSPAPVSAVTEFLVKTEPEQPPEPSSSVDTLTALSDTLISFDTSSTSFKDDEPALAEEEGGSADTRATDNGVEQEPAPELSNCIPITDDLLVLTNGPEETAEPVPPSPGRWSQDLLSGLDSEPNPAKTSVTLDLLADDVIPINTEAHSLSMQREEEKQTDETAKETQSPTETVTITTKTVIVTDKSSADPFDPYPIGTTSPNSSSDLLQPVSDISINSASPSTENKDPSPEIIMSSNALESLADDVIPIDTDTTRLSTQRSWTRSWETSTPQPANEEESQDADPKGQEEDQKMVVMFERKSTESDSPWGRWTSPIITGDEEEEEEEEEESPEDTQTVTTTTTIREMHSEPEPATDRTVMEEDQRVQTPEPEAKKGFVFLKEYVNATETSLYNPRDTIPGASDYLTSSSSSPSSYSSGSLPSTCTYCGELVGSNSKISIEHLGINCHPACFKCGVCSKPMGDLLDGMFMHDGKVNCESCYSRAFE